MSKLHYETISADQKKLLEMLGSLSVGTLVGGTALSLQIGHRKSYDLDFATTQPITESSIKKIKTALESFRISQRLASKTQYTAFADEVKITFFQDEARFLFEPTQFEMFSLASAQDIFSSKLFVMGKRATWRDYVDVAVCLDQKICSLAEGIDQARQRYSISKRWVLDPLTYFQDIEMTPIEWTDREYSQAEIQELIVEAADDYLANN